MSCCSSELLGHGNAGHRQSSTDGPPPLVNAPTYPAFQYLPGIRNTGYVVGCDFQLTPSGVVITRCGFYHVEFQVTLYRDATQEPEYATFVVLLLVNGVLNPADTNLAAASNTMFNGGPTSNGQTLTWVAFNNLALKPGDQLQLVISDAGGGDMPSARVIQWAIVLQKLQGCPQQCCPG